MTTDSSDDATTHVLIGGAGFMGSAFDSHLRRNGRRTLVIGRGALHDEAGRDQLQRTLQQAGQDLVVVDFAYTSVPNTSFDDPIRDYSDNLYNLLRHVQFTLTLPRSRYVYVSSGGTIYGTASETATIDELHRTVPLSPYGITKLACERYALMYHEVHGLPVKIVRPSNVYGPGQKPFRGQGLVSTVAATLLAKRPVKVFGDGSTVRDYLHVDDFCAALDDVVEFGADGEIYNIGSGNGHDINELISAIGRQLRFDDFPIERLPFRPFDVRFNVLDATKMRSLNGWRPKVDLEAGLASSIAWLQSLEPSSAAP